MNVHLLTRLRVAMQNYTYFARKMPYNSSVAMFMSRKMTTFALPEMV